MRKIESFTDKQRGVVTYQMSDGRCVPFAESFIREVGLSEAMRAYGYGHEIPNKRVAVFQSDSQIGTLPGTWDPKFSQSRTWLYSIRPGDFTRSDRGWEACRTLGQGDLEAIPGFVWDRR